MTRAQLFARELDQQLATLVTGYDEAKWRRAAKVATLNALIASGMLDFNGATIAIPDPDPIVETRDVGTAEGVNALLMDGWRLLGADARVEGIRALLGRPKSVEAPSAPEAGDGSAVATKRRTR